jgi:hypothetical protein
MRRGQDSKEDWMNVLRVILGIYERTRNLLGKGLGFYLESESIGIILFPSFMVGYV